MRNIEGRISTLRKFCNTVGLARFHIDKWYNHCTIVILKNSGGKMDIVIDTSALIAVIVGEPERKRIIRRRQEKH